MDETVPPTESHSKSKNTTLAGATHILSLLFGFLAPLVIYLVANDAFVKRNAANALNWQISFTALILLSGVLTIFVVGFVGLLIFPILDLAFCVIAGVKAFDGKLWDYPLTVDLV